MNRDPDPADTLIRRLDKATADKLRDLRDQLNADTAAQISVTTPDPDQADNLS